MTGGARNTSEAFFLGCQTGLRLAVHGILPRVMVAFILVAVLGKSGLLQAISQAFTPLMGFWTLPGEAAVVLATAFFSNAAAVGTAVSMVAAGTLDGADITILMPGMYLMGALIQFSARVLGTSGVPQRLWPLMMAICVVDAAVGMYAMAWIVR